jgi:Ca2+-binding EF-hand superfamily protein
MIRKSVLLAALVTLAPAALLAADPAATAPPAGRPHGEGRWFAQLDANHDGAVSKEEASAAAQARVDKMFANVDANHDGLITQEELRAAEQARRAEAKAKAAARFKAADKNGDGMLSKDEVAGNPLLARHFDALDTNKDGMLSPEELDAAHHHFAGRGGWKGPGNGTPPQR